MPYLERIVKPLGRRLLQSGGYMGVGIKRYRYRAMSQPFLYYLWVYALLQHEAGMSMGRRFSQTALSRLYPRSDTGFLESRAVDLGAAGKDNLYGSGRLDLGSISANYTLTMAVSGNGTVAPSTGNYTYPVGTSVNITATLASGYQFVNWTGNVGTVANVNSSSTNITMSGDYTITANFSAIPAPPGGGGRGGS